LVSHHINEIFQAVRYLWIDKLSPILGGSNRTRTVKVAEERKKLFDVAHPDTATAPLRRGSDPEAHPPSAWQLATYA